MLHCHESVLRLLYLIEWVHVRSVDIQLAKCYQLCDEVRAPDLHHIFCPMWHGPSIFQRCGYFLVGLVGCDFQGFWTKHPRSLVPYGNVSRAKKIYMDLQEQSCFSVKQINLYLAS